MSMEQAFEVATEFKFDVGQAILSSKQLQDSVNGLSSSVNSALGQLNYLAGGLVAHLGLGSGGVLSILTKAVRVSEEFNTLSLGFANDISSNFKVLAGNIATFNDRLMTSQVIMSKIADTSIKFGLDQTMVAQLASKLATPLANRGKLGKNFGNAIELSKNLLLGSEFVGLHPMVASESLYRALSEKMPLHGALFSRLMNTGAFKAAHVTTQGQLQNMNIDKKIDLLTKAMASLAGDAEALRFRLSSISVQFTILKNQLFVMLRPIGDAVRTAIVKVFQIINKYLLENGKQIGENIGKLINNLFEDPRGLLINLMQLKQAGHDFKKSLHMTELYGFFKFLSWGLKLLGIELNGGLLRAGLVGLANGLKYLVALVPWGTVISGVFRVLQMAALEVLPIFAGVLAFFQIISRARAIGKLNDVAEWLKLMPKFTAVFLRLKQGFENIMHPITEAMDFFANLIAPLFETSLYGKIALPILEGIADTFQFLGQVVLLAEASLSGIIYMLINFIGDIIHLHNPFKDAMANFDEGIMDFFEKNKKRFNGDVTNAVVNQVTNVGKIEARFDMREQLEPDRIAFAVTDHLKKLASNPRQGRKQSLARPFAGNMAFGVVN